MPNHRLSWAEVEMLHALYHLRYLTAEQILTAWYEKRALSGGMQRLWRLSAAGILQRTDTLNSHYGVAWSVGPEGLRVLRDVKAERYVTQKSLSVPYIPHQIDTNAVFLELADGEPVWERLSFSWSATKGNSFAYQERRRDDFGVLRKRNARLIPDALITPKSPSKPRIFLELDRSTECLQEEDGRTSIRRKLRAYRTFLFTGSWYEQAFRDERPVRVVFVLARRDSRAAAPYLRDRRKRSIAAAAGEVAADVPLKVVYLDDTDELQAACGIARTKRGRRPRPRSHNTACLLPRWTTEDFQRLNALHRKISHLYPRMTGEMQQQILKEANGAQAVLARVAKALTNASAGHASVHPDRRMQAEMQRMQSEDAPDAGTVH